MKQQSTLLNDLVQRVCQVVHPLRIVLFGSAVRDEMTPDSDLDILVVVPEGVHRRHTAQCLHENLFGFPVPVDVLVTTPDHLTKHQDNKGLIYYHIVREGRDIYAV